MRKFTYKEVKKIFKDGGCELLEEVYINAITKMRYRCSCKRLSKITLGNFRNGIRCKGCSHERGSAKQRRTIKEVKKIFKDGGCELLEIVYKNNRTPMLFLCNCGRTAKISLTRFRNGGRCKKCAGERISFKKRFIYEEVKEIFRKGGCKLISKSYENSYDKLEYLCNCKRLSEITLNNFRVGSRCKKCAIERSSGENHYNYNFDLTDEERNKRGNSPENAEWRKKVFVRDDFTCQINGEKGGKLVAHHLESYDINVELRLVVSNGITIKKYLHILFHNIYGYGKNTTAQFVEFQEFQKNYQQNLLNIEV